MEFVLAPITTKINEQMQAELRIPETWEPYNWFGYGYNALAPANPLLAQAGPITPDEGKLALVADGHKLAGRVHWYLGSWYGGSPRHRGWSVGIIVFQEFRRTSAAETGLTLLIDYLFTHTTAHRIEGVTAAPPNGRQRAGASRPAGMTFEAVVRQAQWRDGAWRDVFLYSVLRDEWERDQQ